jgi:GNAT superfamily N-acetyltransferase
VRVRRAVVPGAEVIERVRTDTWRDAYRGLMPDSLLYVLPQHHGRGLGRAMLHAAAKELVDRGLSSMIIWALRENAPSRRFYERMGGKYVRDEERELKANRGDVPALSQRASLAR